MFVVGIGLHRYQRPSDVPYTVLGVTAVRAALADAAIEWSEVESAYTGTATIAMGMSRLMYRHLGSSGVPSAQVENASASGSTAFRQACFEVAGGISDVTIAVGVDKPLMFGSAVRAAGINDLSGDRVVPFTHFALIANRHMYEHGTTPEDFARVAVKNSRNGALNPYAQRQTARTVEQVLEPPQISGPLTRLQCTPIGEGAAAVIVASEPAIARLGIDQSRAVRVLASSSRSERVYGTENFDAALTREATSEALDAAGVRPRQIDVLELHDAFTVEELLYVEAMGITAPGHAAGELAEGQYDIGGRVAVSASGGLLAMGHPIGPTGAGQVCEVTRQLRGEAGPRQHPGAQLGLAHMVGLGAVCVVHVLAAPH